MAPEEEVGVSRKRRRKDVPETGPYILRTLVENVPLASEGDASDIEISCVELWGKLKHQMSLSVPFI